MQIFRCGGITPCRNIIFDDKVPDLKSSHPGIILIPTSHNEDVAYCIYMTSDEGRAKNEGYKYTKYHGWAKKESFVNLHNIIIRRNNIDKELDCMSSNDYYDLLKKFYNYQCNLKPQKSEFLEIKKKLEVLLVLLEMKIKLEIDDDIKAEDINSLEKIDDINKIRELYAISSMKKGYDIYKNFGKKEFVPNKKIIYYQKVIDLYDDLKKIDRVKFDLADPNNVMRSIYYKYKTNNYAIDTDNLFQDVAIIFAMDSTKENLAKKIDLFLQYERKLEEVKHQKKMMKILGTKKGSDAPDDPDNPNLHECDVRDD